MRPGHGAEEFLLAKASYKAVTGREQKKETDVLCYQIRMAFYPGEITPKEGEPYRLRIGYALDEGPPRFSCDDPHGQEAYPLSHLLQFHLP